MRSVLTIFLISLTLGLSACNSANDNDNELQDVQQQDTLRNNAIEDANQLLGNDSASQMNNNADSLSGSDSLNSPKNK